MTLFVFSFVGKKTTHFCLKISTAVYLATHDKRIFDTDLLLCRHKTIRAAAEILLQFAEPFVQLQKYFCNLQNLSCSCGNAFVKSQNHSCSCGNTFVSTQNLLCKNKFIFCSCGFVIRRKANSLLAIGKHELKYSRQQDFIFHKSIF